MMRVKSGWAVALVLIALVGCRPTKPKNQGNDTTGTFVPEIPKSVQIAFENEKPYGLDFEQGFAAEGETLAYEDTKAGLESDMLTGYFIKAKPGKAALLYLRHEDTMGGVGTHVLSLQLPGLAAGTDSITREKFKGVLYISYNTPDADFFQARRGQGVVVLEAATPDSVKGTLDLALVGKRAAGRVADSQPKEMNLKLSGRFALSRKSSQDVLALQKAREAQASNNPYQQRSP